MTMINKTLED